MTTRRNILKSLGLGAIGLKLAPTILKEVPIPKKPLGTMPGLLADLEYGIFTPDGMPGVIGHYEKIGDQVTYYIKGVRFSTEEEVKLLKGVPFKVPTTLM